MGLGRFSVKRWVLNQIRFYYILHLISNKIPYYLVEALLFTSAKSPAEDGNLISLPEAGSSLARARVLRERKYGKHQGQKVKFNGPWGGGKSPKDPQVYPFFWKERGYSRGSKRGNLNGIGKSYIYCNKIKN